MCPFDSQEFTPEGQLVFLERLPVVAEVIQSELIWAYLSWISGEPTSKNIFICTHTDAHSRTQTAKRATCKVWTCIRGANTQSEGRAKKTLTQLCCWAACPAASQRAHHLETVRTSQSLNAPPSNNCHSCLGPNIPVNEVPLRFCKGK